MEASSVQPYHRTQSMSSLTSTRSSSPSSSLGSLLRIPKIVADFLPKPCSTRIAASGCRDPVALSEKFDYTGPPPTPPTKDDVSAPTPTTSPYVWLVPETSGVLLAFLALIYPSLAVSGSAPLTSTHAIGRVIRAAMGYQSTRAINRARTRLAEQVDIDPVGVYAMASFFNFAELAKLASMQAASVSEDQWTEADVRVMGTTARRALCDLQCTRREGLANVLTTPMAVDEHSLSCSGMTQVQTIWREHAARLVNVPQGQQIAEMLNVNIESVQCASCLKAVGQMVRHCVVALEQLPRSV